jgi:hypothetical protein
MSLLGLFKEQANAERAFASASTKTSNIEPSRFSDDLGLEGVRGREG